MLKKLKNIMGYGEEKIIETETKIEEVYEKKVYKEAKIEKSFCDCCNQNEIEIEIRDPYIIQSDNTTSHLYTHPKITFTGGGIYDDIVICDECFKDCIDDTERQIVWVTGKVNSIKKEISDIADEREKSIVMIEKIKKEAEEKIQRIVEDINMLDMNINEKNNDIEAYFQEQDRLISQIQNCEFTE